MPRITYIEAYGFKFYIYYNDHLPMHVHAKKPPGEVVINFESEVEIREIRGDISTKDIKKAIKIVVESQQYLIQEWSAIHERQAD